MKRSPRKVTKNHFWKIDNLSDMLKLSQESFLFLYLDRMILSSSPASRLASDENESSDSASDPFEDPEFEPPLLPDFFFFGVPSSELSSSDASSVIAPCYMLDFASAFLLLTDKKCLWRSCLSSDDDEEELDSTCEAIDRLTLLRLLNLAEREADAGSYC